MNDYSEIRLDLTPCSEEATDVMAALLADIGYESFVADEHGITAYIRATAFSADDLSQVIAEFPLPDYSISSPSVVTIEGQDWNSEWEKHYFKPIVIGKKCVVHSSFHTDIPSAEYDIVIDPKMAFGTGHHATTSQVATALLEMDLHGLTVTDMGTGTGILSILAAMHGAARVTGIEIDPPAWENAVDNVRLNHVESVATMLLGDASALESTPKADLFLANINRNIITADLSAYVRACRPGAILIFSGFYTEDIPVIMDVAKPLGLKEIRHTSQDNWCCLICQL